MSVEGHLYAAGVIDSGSYFSIIKVNGWYTASVRIRRSTPEVIDHLHELYGGSRGAQRKDEGWIYWLNYRDAACRNILLPIMPYLKTKLPHAKLILEFLHDKEEFKANRHAGQKLSDDQHAKRDLLISQMQAL